MTTSRPTIPDNEKRPPLITRAIIVGGCTIAAILIVVVAAWVSWEWTALSSYIDTEGRTKAD